MEIIPELCDMCATLATQRAWDMYSRDNWETGLVEYKPTGKVKHGCDDHPVFSDTFDMTSWNQPYAEAW